MERVLQNLLDPSWWFTSVVVALVVSVVAMPLHNWLAKRWVSRVARRQVVSLISTATFRAELERMKQHPELVAVKLIDDRSDQGQFVLLVFAGVAITLDTIAEFGNASVAVKVALVLGPLGVLLLLLNVYRRMLRRSLLLAAYREQVLRSVERGDG
ncbi:MAG: hypothetical protein KIT60_12180 [Burkholderiaceae bacterium]|nr:hypothetical protein [Burkholderiaceae bacterium]